MPNRGREVSYELRCCIICLRLLFPPPQNTFQRIGVLLDLQPNTYQRIWQQAQARAGSNELREVLACVGRLERTGRPPVIANGIASSTVLRALILQMNDRQLSDVSQVWEEQTG